MSERPPLPVRGVGGLQVGAQGFGCMGLSQSYGAPSGTAEAVRVVHQALEAGATLLDTADVYGGGANEEVVGRAVERRRDQAVVATKFGIVRGDDGRRGVRGDPTWVRTSCEGSLRRLRTDHVDLYYLHRVDPDVPAAETWGAMVELVQAGKVRHLGISEASATTLREIHAIHPVTALQSEWSLWSRGIEDEIAPVCAELGIGIVPFAPLGRGFLAGAVRGADALGADDWRRRLPRFSDDNLDANRVVTATIADVASRHGATLAQVALAWVHHRGPHVVPIPGTRSIDHLHENLAAATLTLSVDDLRDLDRCAAEVTGARYPADLEARTRR